MKKVILPLLVLLLISPILPAQITYSPSCYSNADGWTIDQIETNDNDFIVPFKSIEAIRDFIQSQDNQQKYSSELEQYLNKTVSEMNGAELACVGLTILWNSQ